MRSKLFLFSFSVALVVACGNSGSGGNGGSSSGTPAGALDCTWLTGPNCYQAVVSAASACLPAPGAHGTMSADGKTCTYAGGQVVTFDSPVTIPPPSHALFDFTVTSGGTQCMKFNESASDTFTVTTSAGTFGWTPQGGAETATCPDGSSYAASGKGAIALVSCDGGQGLPPTTAVESTATALQFSLYGLGSPSGLQIFDCQTM